MHPALSIAIALFALLGHGYFWIALVNRLHGWSGPHRLIDVLTWGALLAFLVLPPLVAIQWWQLGAGFLTDDYQPPVPAMTRLYVIAIAFFGFGKLLAKFIGGWQLDDPQAIIAKSRRTVSPVGKQGLLHGPYARLLGSVPGNQALELTVDNKQLAVPRLPQELVGFRIAHVSDWHLTGRIGEEWFVHVAQTVNSLGANAVMVTGDLLENENCRPWLASSLGQLQAEHGVYFVLGNHDYYVDAMQTIAQLENHGFAYACGKRIDLTWNGVRVSIIGNEVPWNRKLPSHMWDLDAFKIALVHTPDQFDWACVNHADLVLAGHTHGGQVCFPILGAVAAPSLYGTRLAGGTFRRGNTVMHVTRGISGETPMRWLCPPEIAVLELARGDM